jgi:hypothetical protein
MRLALIWGLLSTGCTTATIGPYVTDIQQEDDGRLRIVSCTTEVRKSGTAISIETGDCTTKTLEPVPTQAPAREQR